jgi:hypothetical protein
MACFLAQTGKNRTIWATDVGETDDVDDDGVIEDDGEDREDEMDPTVKAKEVLRKGPIWGLRGNVDISKYLNDLLPIHPDHIADYTLCLLNRSDRPQFEPGSQVIPLTLDWYDAVPANTSDDKMEAEAYKKMVEFSRGLPDDLIILATDVVSGEFQIQIQNGL